MLHDCVVLVCARRLTSFGGTEGAVKGCCGGWPSDRPAVCLVRWLIDGFSPFFLVLRV